jgi:hypothetical protein
MTLDDLRAALDPIQSQLAAWAVTAEEDEFAPWVVRALRLGADCAALEPNLLAELKEQDIAA